MKKKRWKSLVHNGVAFPPEYEYKGINIKIKGKEQTINVNAEEMIYAWAKKKDTPYIQDKIFQQNFLKSLLPILPKEYRKIKYIDLNFSNFYELVEGEKREKENLTKENKKEIAKERKEKREILKKKYGYAKIDEIEVEVSNWMIEPPGLYMGRGQHPLRGTWKNRVYSKDVTLNLSKNVSKPEGKWKKVSDNTSMWLAKWSDKTDPEKQKYVWPSESSFLRQQQDQEKYNKSVMLEKKIRKIKRVIQKTLASKTQIERKIATVCYLIDILALRVGDEKDEDETDTVGATTLRIEHVKIKKESIEFKFLGKDSVVWHKKLENPPKQIIKNFNEFIQNKKSDDLIFDNITSEKVNKFFKKIMLGLSAKVFRTYIASKIVKEYLDNESNDKQEDYVKLFHAKKANLEAAKKCNHKRQPPKNWENSILKREMKLKELINLKLPKTGKAKQKRKQRIEKYKLQLEFAKNTLEYNLNTSLKSYIDPRIYYKWSSKVNLYWEKIYPKTLQKKFKWVDSKKR